jgi:DNA-binding transcriptional MocR family regulator
VKLNPRLYSQILYDMRIGLCAFKLWHLLRDRTGDHQSAWPGFRSLKRDLGAGAGAIQQAIKQLESAGYLRVKVGNRRRSSEYFLKAVPIQEHRVPKQERNLSQEPNKRTEGAMAQQWEKDLQAWKENIR